MGSTFICNVCKDAVRVDNADELTTFQKEHQTLDQWTGIYESAWKNWKEMTLEQRNTIAAKVLFKHGHLGKLQV